MLQIYIPPMFLSAGPRYTLQPEKSENINQEEDTYFSKETVYAVVHFHEPALFSVINRTSSIALFAFQVPPFPRMFNIVIVHHFHKNCNHFLSIFVKFQSIFIAVYSRQFLNSCTHIIEAFAGIQTHINIFTKKIRCSREVY